jgi:hypothetical protein
MKWWGDRLYKTAWCKISDDYSVKIPSRENLNTFTVYDSDNLTVKAQGTFVTVDTIYDYRWIEV